MNRLFTSALASVFFASTATNASEDIDLFSMSLEELLSVNIAISSNMPAPISKQPSVVTVITGEMIEQTGARFLWDVLKLIPSTGLNTDILETHSLSYRGIWAGEGKVLVLIDGIEQNSISLGFEELGQHFSMENVERIEIIRGPGSVKYGGNAELMVVKVRTKGAGMSGSHVPFTSDIIESGADQNNVAFITAGDFRDSHYSLSGNLGQGERLQGDYHASDGTIFNYDNRSLGQVGHLNFGLTSTDWVFQILYDENRYEGAVVAGDFDLGVTDSYEVSTSN